MCYIILPVLAGVLIAWSTVSAWMGLVSTSWWVSPTGGMGIASNCATQKTVNTDLNLGALNSGDTFSMTFCSGFSWGALDGPVEEAMAGMCIVAGCLGIFALIFIVLEVLFRCCFKPHPIVPKLSSLMALLQCLCIVAVCITFAGHFNFQTPEGYKIGISYYMMMVSIATSFVAFIFMGWASKSERKRYNERFQGAPTGERSDTAFASTAHLSNRKDGVSTSTIDSKY